MSIQLREPRLQQLRAPRRMSNRAVGLAVAAVVLVAAGYGIYYLFGHGTGAPPPRTDVAEFSGDSSQTTDSFSVQEPWQIHWETEGESFSYAIEGDRDYGTIIEQDGPGSGVTSPVGSGTFHLVITADGPWTVRIFQNE
jgi:hypothetical protein